MCLNIFELSVYCVFTQQHMFTMLISNIVDSNLVKRAILFLYLLSLKHSREIELKSNEMKFINLPIWLTWMVHDVWIVLKFYQSGIQNEQCRKCRLARVSFQPLIIIQFYIPLSSIYYADVIILLE